MAYKERHGDCNVPEDCRAEDLWLRHWISVQRFEEPKLWRPKLSGASGGPSGDGGAGLTVERVATLTALGFVWGAASPSPRIPVTRKARRNKTQKAWRDKKKARTEVLKKLETPPVQITRKLRKKRAKKDVGVAGEGGERVGGLDVDHNARTLYNSRREVRRWNTSTTHQVLEAPSTQAKEQFPQQSRVQEKCTLDAGDIATWRATGLITVSCGDDAPFVEPGGTRSLANTRFWHDLPLPICGSAHASDWGPNGPALLCALRAWRSKRYLDTLHAKIFGSSSHPAHARRRICQGGPSGISFGWVIGMNGDKSCIRHDDTWLELEELGRLFTHCMDWHITAKMDACEAGSSQRYDERLDLVDKCRLHGTRFTCLWIGFLRGEAKITDHIDKNDVFGSPVASLVLTPGVTSQMVVHLARTKGVCALGTRDGENIETHFAGRGVYGGPLRTPASGGHEATFFTSSRCTHAHAPPPSNSTSDGSVGRPQRARSMGRGMPTTQGRWTIIAYSDIGCTNTERARKYKRRGRKTSRLGPDDRRKTSTSLFE